MAKNETTPTCSMSFCSCRDSSIEPDSAAKPPATTSCAVVPKKFDGVVTWILGGFTTAFFASLERCSCINIATKDDVDDGGSLPLIDSDVSSPATDVIYKDHHADEDHTVEDKKDAVRVN
ncbi:hypothetical protein BUALT_Bualt04G0098200 [Buddleja alternifolia]|uniref:Uncharacterized protein n=1 Tax=Buddleja alternifolia TaxID=168488 RepID=A0AAV6XMP1_9LAMI|nr:hypothetical protein BUALT_Bualt04G0098200 [Buddleja alternifolia]